MVRVMFDFKPELLKEGLDSVRGWINDTTLLWNTSGVPEQG